MSIFVLCVAFSAHYGDAIAASSREDDDEAEPWVESEVVLPASSVAIRPLRFQLDAPTDNAFAIDAASIKVSADGVIRFMVVIESTGGATTVTYEGLRCDGREGRRYAYGRRDGTWTRARSERWRRIQVGAINGYAVTLYREYFCPKGLIVRDAAAAIEALERGGHPENRLLP